MRKDNLNFLPAILLGVVLAFSLCSFKYSHKEGNVDADYEEMRTLYYRGHSYICYRFSKRGFTKGEYTYSGASIEHDPDCKCHMKGGVR